MFINAIIQGIGQGVGFTVVVLCFSSFLLFTRRRDSKRDGEATLKMMAERNDLDRQKVAVLTDIYKVMDYVK